MNETIIEKEKKFIKIKDVYDDGFQITEGVKNILVEKNGITYIPFSEIKNLMGEYGGSPFTYTYKYSDWYGNGWSVDKTSEGSYYLSDDVDSYDEYDLFNWVRDNLNHPNFGYDLSEKIRKKVLDTNRDSDGERKKCEGDKRYFIPFKLLVWFMVTQNEHMIDILFHRDEYDDLQYLTDRTDYTDY